jgi:hypothetical protein
MSTGVDGLSLVTTGRTRTLARTCVILAALGWALRPVVSALAPGSVLLHEGLPPERVLVTFAVVPTALIALLVVVCLNRVLLHATAWCTAGILTNLGEIVATGSVADYVQIGQRIASPGDVYMGVGFCLLGLGGAKVVYDGYRRDPAAT